MRYVLVIQFHESYFTTPKDVVTFEQRLRECMPRTCEVDGCDAGGGTANFFVLTEAPLAAHKTFRKFLGTNAVERKVRVAYRDALGSQFTNLWPFRDDRPFALTYKTEDDPFRPASKRQIPKRSKPGVSKLKTLAKPAVTSSRNKPAK
jgi:hypothetical protein